MFALVRNDLKRTMEPIVAEPEKRKIAGAWLLNVELTHFTLLRSFVGGK